MRRPTIADIAAACGVSATAVSFALNGRPGVSEARRAQILDTAERLGWTPSVAARALSTSRVGAIGLIMSLPVDAVSRDTFYLRFIAGIERALVGTPDVLVLKVVETLEEELAVLRLWHRQKRVDGIVLVNPRIDDPRPELVHDLGLPAVFAGDLGLADGQEPPASSVSIDDARTMTALLTDLVARGMRDIAYLHTASPFRHAAERLRGLASSADIGVRSQRAFQIDEADGTTVAAAIETILDELIARGLPDVLICEDEWITLATLDALARRGMSVPDDLGLVSWESGPGLTMRTPAISTLERDPMLLGERAAQILLDQISCPGAPVHDTLAPPRLTIRDT